MKTALIIVDLQNDFVPGGALAVKGGDEIVELINRLQPRFDMVVATLDWHPANHGSFAANHPNLRPFDQILLGGLPQVLWPVHCVQGTHGAVFAPELNVSRIAWLFKKGTDAGIDSYSGFFDNGHRKATGLGDFLRDNQVTDVYVAGLATDYCVKYTALDARKLGFSTYLIEDACRGVDLREGDVVGAVAEMKAAGVGVVQSGELL
jgi:nicotinamidase/pyrazinamidase